MFDNSIPSLFLCSLSLFRLLSLDNTSLYFSLSLCPPSHLSLLPFPLLVTTWMCHYFYHFRGSCPLKRSEVISGVPKQRQDLYPPPQRMALLTPFTARPVGHMTALTTPPRHGRKAPGCINKGAKGEEESETDQTRWRWSSPGLTGCLQLQVFFCGPLVGRLHPWSATLTPEHCVCSRGGTTHWGKPGWTTCVCSAPVCTLSVSVAARREYTNNLCGLVSRCPQLLYLLYTV